MPVSLKEPVGFIPWCLAKSGGSAGTRQPPEWPSAAEEARRSRHSHLSAPGLGRSGPLRWLQPGYSTSNSSPQTAQRKSGRASAPAIRAPHPKQRNWCKLSFMPEDRVPASGEFWRALDTYATLCQRGSRFRFLDCGAWLRNGHGSWANRERSSCGNYQERCVILELSLAKGRDLREQPAIQLACGESSVGLCKCCNTRFFEFLPVRIRRFRDAVGEQEQAVPCPQLDHRVLVFPAWEYAEHCAALLQHVDRTGRDEDGVKMSGVAVLKRTRFTIEDSVKKRHELPRRNVLVQQAVDFAAHPGRALRVARKRANRGLHIGHQKRGRYPFSDHVGNADSKPVVAEPEHVGGM